MLTLLFSMAMAGMAEREKRSPWIWGFLTALISASIQTFLIAGYWGAVLGLFAAFGLMTWANIKYPVKKGPTIDIE
jgi:hypothetical protein